MITIDARGILERRKNEIIEKTTALERQSITLDVCLHEFNANSDNELELIKVISCNIEKLVNDLKKIIDEAAKYSVHIARENRAQHQIEAP